MRFSLVDKIVALEGGRSVTAIKNLSLAEEYLADHFPGVPLMPGVLMLESMVQAGAWLMRYTEDFRYSTILLREARAVRFNNFVTPGKSLTVTASVHERGETRYVLKGAGTVDGQSAVSARLTLEQSNSGDTDPRAAQADRECIASMRDLFRQLWTPSLASAETT